MAPHSYNLLRGSSTMDTVPSVWLRLRDRLRFGLAMQEILDRLGRLGFIVYPYFVVVEPIVERPEAERLPDELRTQMLAAADAALIATVAERQRDESMIRETMTWARCLAVMQDDELLAYSWFVREQLRGPLSGNLLGRLPQDWAYSFDMYVRPKARGRSLAVQLRHKIHRLLAEQGVSHCCSITLAFNRSSRRFKSKLGAVVQELRLLLRLKPFPALDLRLWRRPWAVRTPLMSIVRPVADRAAPE